MSAFWDDPSPLSNRAVAGYAVALVAIVSAVWAAFTATNSSTMKERDALRDSVTAVRARNDTLSRTLQQTGRQADSLGAVVRTLNVNAGNCGQWYTILRASVDTLTLRNQQAYAQVGRLWEVQELDKRWQAIEAEKADLASPYRNNHQPQLLRANVERIELLQRSQDQIQERIRLRTQQATSQ